MVVIVPRWRGSSSMNERKMLRGPWLVYMQARSGTPKKQSQRGRVVAF